MAQENEVQMMNNLKRKQSSNVPENDFQNKKAPDTDSAAFEFIEEFLKEEESKERPYLHKKHYQRTWWQNQEFLFPFLRIVGKIILHRRDKDPLKHVLHDIEKLCIDILGLPHIPRHNIYTTIVTSALQVSKDHEHHCDDKDGVVKVQPKPQSGFISAVIDSAVHIVAKIILYPNSPAPPSSAMLEGDFKPIREETSPTSNLIIVKGKIPANLNGMMIRNGANPAYDPEAKYAWMDGDSMLHAIRFKQGKAIYVSRYVQTSRLKQENFFGKAEFLKYGDLEGKFGIWMSCVQLLRAKLKVLDVSYGWLNGTKTQNNLCFSVKEL